MEGGLVCDDVRSFLLSSHHGLEYGIGKRNNLTRWTLMMDFRLAIRAGAYIYQIEMIWTFVVNPVMVLFVPQSRKSHCSARIRPGKGDINLPYSVSFLVNNIFDE